MSRTCLLARLRSRWACVVVGFLLSGKGSIGCFRFLPGSRFYTANGNGCTRAFSGLEPQSLLGAQLGMALNFLVAVPAFLFFQETGFVGRAGRIIAYTVCLLEMCLIGAIFIGLPLRLLNHLNSGLMIAGSVSLLILGFLRRNAGRDVVVLRAGVVIFVCFVVWTNAQTLLGHRPGVEPYGFALFLCCLGYVAAKRALDRDQQLASLRQELEVARRIQLSILPTGFPVSEHFTVAARYVPMTSVAGDFYEFLNPEGARPGLLVADVSGHGVPAALIASMVKVATNSQRHHAASPDRLMAGVNQALCGNTQDQFVTAAYVYLDAEKGELGYAAAGHPPMLLLREGRVSSIEENGLLMGVFSQQFTTPLSEHWLKGDRLLLYTDGLIEATNGGEEEFGQERLCKLLAESAEMAAEQTADLILSTVQGWASTQTDDLTVVVCDCS